jgi:hypothetical protein
MENRRRTNRRQWARRAPRTRGHADAATRPGLRAHAELAVDRSAVPGTHSFRVGFTAIGSHDTLWSNPASVSVIAARQEVKTSARHLAPREIAFSLTNTTNKPIEIADHLVLQRQLFGHLWVDMTWVSASACAAPPVGCVTLAPGATRDAATWLGTTCGQCVCHANTPAEAGGISSGRAVVRRFGRLRHGQQPGDRLAREPVTTARAQPSRTRVGRRTVGYRSSRGRSPCHSPRTRSATKAGLCRYRR